MHPDRRHGLLQLQAKLVQLISDVEELTASECDDDKLQGATKALAELKETVSRSRVNRRTTIHGSSLVAGT